MRRDHPFHAPNLKEIGIFVILAAGRGSMIVKPMTCAQTLYSVSQVADILSVSKSVVKSWEKSGKLVPQLAPDKGGHVFAEEDLRKLDPMITFFRKTPGGDPPFHHPRIRRSAVSSIVSRKTPVATTPTSSSPPTTGFPAASTA
jgi:hypothetical protein